MSSRWSKLLLVLVLIPAGCLEPYAPPLSDQDVDILVVDGFLDSNEGTALVSLTKAVPLSSEDATATVSFATVTLYDDTGASFPLNEESAGQYRVSGVAVRQSAKYRIFIRTQAGNEYQSSLMGIYQTPPIDSVTWTTNDDELSVRVNTHDYTNATQHFRWSYEETWAYHAAVLSQYKVVGKQYMDRTPEEYIFYCYKTQQSKNILIGSTERLSENIVSQAPLRFIRKGSQELSMKYSILVGQRGLSEEEYTYLDQLKKTTESVGGLFDPQPSQVPGNISRLDPSSPIAIGFFGVGNTVKQRIFISSADLPRDFQLSPIQAGCYPPDTVCIFPTTVKICNVSEYDLNEGTTLGGAVYSGMSLVGITLTSPGCADCRLEGGVLKRPEFWE
jgi:hypothetical protein